MVSLKIAGGVFVGLIISAAICFQFWQLYEFVNAGPRFTAEDGQELCKRIMALEQTNGIKKPCHYVGREPIW